MASPELPAGVVEELKVLHMMIGMACEASHKLAARLDKEGIEVPGDINRPLSVIWAQHQIVGRTLERYIKARKF